MTEFLVGPQLSWANSFYYWPIIGSQHGLHISLNWQQLTKFQKKEKKRKEKEEALAINNCVVRIAYCRAILDSSKVRKGQISNQNEGLNFEPHD